MPEDGESGRLLPGRDSRLRSRVPVSWSVKRAGRENFQDVGMEAGPDSPGIWSPRGLFRGKWSDPTCRSERLLSDCGLKEEAEGNSRIFDVQEGCARGGVPRAGFCWERPPPPPPPPKGLVQTFNLATLSKKGRERT